MKKLFLVFALIVALVFPTFSFATGNKNKPPQDKSKIHIHHNQFTLGSGNTTTNKNSSASNSKANAKSDAKAKANANAAIGDITNNNTNHNTNNNINTNVAQGGDAQATATGGNAQVGDIANNAQVGNVTGIEGGINFNIKDAKNWPTLPNIVAPNIQPQFVYEDLLDGSDWAGAPSLLTRKMARAAIPSNHPIQGFLKKLKPLTGVWELKNSKAFKAVYLPMDEKFDVKRESVDKIAKLDWDKENLPSETELLQSGLVYQWLGKLTGSPAVDANTLFNAMAVKGMDMGMTHFMVFKVMKKQVATSEGNNLNLVGDVLGAASNNAWGVGAGGGSERSHLFNDLIHSFHVGYFVYDPIRANERLQEIAGIPPINTENGEQDGKYAFRVFSDYVTFEFGQPKIVDGDENTAARMGAVIIENWDFIKEYNMQALLLVHRDERPDGNTKKNRQINGELGLASGAYLRDLILSQKNVQLFLKENNLRKRDWEKIVVYATTGADHPLIIKAQGEDHEQNRTGHLLFVPGGIRSQEKSLYTQEDMINSMSGN